MYRPDGKCKICDRVLETDFSSKSAQEHYFSNADKVIPSKCMPCLHTICCVQCSKVENYMECPFCENQIKKVVYYLVDRQQRYGRHEWEYMYSWKFNSE